ncbi:MAG: hypothetical protein NW216_04510 [Hyphomicrobium sp.]|nr:hypothetical protein [Hyphomicrobium sp.]
MANDDAHPDSSIRKSEDEITANDRKSSALEAECARLKDDLARAEARIAELEKLRALAIDRVNWVIDSLESSLEDPTERR